ncbi:MAG: metal ABC transporter permease [Rhodospirillales bacterium]|nr:metal ABC transporter permease [Rhodospirillales bacterium]MDE0711486.1 metal ABC transporter permease [Rhodospirillales bacterium]
MDDFLLRALLAGIGLAMVAGPAGCFIVWRRLAYFGETIAHSALLGVAIAVLVNLHLVIGIFVTAVVVVLAMSYLERRDTLPTDTLLGLLSHGGLAVGLVLLSFFPDMRLDLQGLLFGDILAVSRLDLAVVWGGGAIALALLWWIWRPLLAATVSADLATVAGLRPERALLVFGILLAAVIAAAIKIVGVLLIVALLIIPSATVRRFTSSPEQMAAGAAVTGVIAVAGGLLASATLDTPSGPSIVVTALAVFLVTRLGRPRRERGAR